MVVVTARLVTILALILSGVPSFLLSALTSCRSLDGDFEDIARVSQQRVDTPISFGLCRSRGRGSQFSNRVRRCW